MKSSLIQLARRGGEACCGFCLHEETELSEHFLNKTIQTIVAIVPISLGELLAANQTS